MERGRDALSQFKIHVAGRAMGGGAETLREPGDQVACGVSPPSCVSVENYWSEADAVLVTSVGRSRDHEIPSFEDHVLSGVNPHGGTVNSGLLWWTGLEVSCFEACFLCGFVEDVGPPHCVCGCRLQHMEQTAAWSQGSRTWPHKRHCVSWSQKGTRRRCCNAVRVRSALPRLLQGRVPAHVNFSRVVLFVSRVSAYQRLSHA